MAARYLTLAVLLAFGSILVRAGMRPSAAADAARWPTEDSVFSVEGWQVSAARVDTAPAKFRVINRTYANPHGTRVDFSLWTSPDPKRIYRADPTIPYLNAGYVIDPVPTDLAGLAHGRDLMLLHDASSRQFLEMHVYAERRGALGSGPLAWAFATLDTGLGISNDYQLLRLVVPLGTSPAQSVRDATDLADTLVPRITSWYAVQ